MKTNLSHRHKTVQEFLEKVISSLGEFNVSREKRELERLPIAQIMAPLYRYFDEFNLDAHYGFVKDLGESPDYRITIGNDNFESLLYGNKITKFQMYVEMRLCVDKETEYYVNPVSHNYQFNFVSNGFFGSTRTMREDHWRFSLSKIEMVYCGNFWTDGSYIGLGNDVINYDKLIEEFERKEEMNDE